MEKKEAVHKGFLGELLDQISSLAHRCAVLAGENAGLRLELNTARAELAKAQQAQPPAA